MKNTLKAIKRTKNKIIAENYIVLFGDEGQKDLQGEFFTKSTKLDSMHTRLGRLPQVWEHGVFGDEGEASRDEVLGYVDWQTAKVDKAGVFVRRILDRRNQYIDMLDRAGLFDAGWIGTSSEADPRTAVVKSNGEIVEWPLSADSLTVTPAEPRMLTENQLQVVKSLAKTLPGLKSLFLEADGTSATEDETTATDTAVSDENEEQIMSEKDKDTAVDNGQDAILAAIKGLGEQTSSQLKAFDDRLQKLESTPDNELPVATGSAAKGVNVVTDTSDWKYDNWDTQDLALSMQIMNASQGDSKGRAPSAAMKRGFFRRLESEEAKKDKGLNEAARRAKSLRIKADETNFSTNVGFGDEWVGVAYSSDLWEKVRVENFVIGQLASANGNRSAPPGAETITFPIEGSDPVWYTVAQAGDPASATAQVTNTVPAKALGMGKVVASLAKSGTSVIYTGEMQEDSVLDFASTLRSRIVISGAEILEAIAINGDTDGSATTNINDIGGTPAATDWFMVADGFRKSCLVTTTANSRDGGTLASADFIETAKLMGDAGIVALDPTKVAFILDPYTHYKAIQLADVKSLDVFTGATIEAGMLSNIFGSRVHVSGQMHKGGTNLLANSAGKVDLDTQGNNTTGAILCVRWDQWRFGYRRDMTMEVERIPRADAWEVTSLMRFYLAQRDTEASAISYNLTV